MVLDTFDKDRSEKDLYFEKTKAFFQKARLSEHYSKTLNLLNTALQDVTGVDIITLAFYDKQTNELYVVDSVGLPANITIPRQSVNKGIVGAAFQQKRAIVVQDVSQDKRYIKIDESICSELAMPIEFNNELIGVMNFESRKRDFFDGAVMGVIEIIYDHIIALLRNAFEIYKHELVLRSKVDEYRETSLFLREIAHEMRNRLHIIVQLPRYVLETDPKNWNATLIKVQSQEIKEGIELLGGSLNKAIESRRIYTPVCKTIKIGDIFDEIKNIIFMEVTKGFIEYSEDVEPGLDDREMVTDKDYVVSIITNILLNSMEAYAKRGISQEAKNLLNVKRYAEAEKLLVVKIQDFAGGINGEIALKMSDPSIYNVGNRTGLNIVKRYVATLRGNVSYKVLDSPGATGTEVEVRLPLTEEFERGKF
jgi:GAF domain-containing protein